MKAAPWPAVLLLSLVAAAGCTSGGSAPPSSPASVPTSAPVPSPSPSPAPTPRLPTSRSSPAAAPTVVEPTTTNTLPPPPEPSRPAPSTAGPLTPRSMPRPPGWKTVVRPGGSEEGYQGNGTWVHARDPRYAAQAVVAVGCAAVTRDDYPDPVAALEGTYERQGQPGISLALQFADQRRAAAFWRVYLSQVKACTRGDGAVRTEVLEESAGLVDRRSGDDGEWTEVGVRRAERVTLVLLSDPGHRISEQSSRRLLDRLRA